jgi:hypothetical protein
MACSNRLFLGFLGVLDEGVEFGFEGSGVGGDVSGAVLMLAQKETLEMAWR